MISVTPHLVPRISLALLTFGLTLMAAGAAEAQYSDEYRDGGQSPEHVDWQLHIGPYTPYPGSNAFDEIFGSDGGPMVAMEFDFHLVRIPYVGVLQAGFRAGWAKYRARACALGTDGLPDCSNRADEREKLVLLPLTLLAALKIDVLAEELNIPLVITGKLGLDVHFWRNRRGGSTVGSGRSLGLRWGCHVRLRVGRDRAPRSASPR